MPRACLCALRLACKPFASNYLGVWSFDFVFIMKAHLNIGNYFGHKLIVCRLYAIFANYVLTNVPVCE